MKQTAVEWLWRWIMDNPFGSFEDGVKAYNQAKAMEKEQMCNARLDGFKTSGEGWNGEYPFEGKNDHTISEEIDNNKYYTETYNK
jgi:hypothetical protein